MEADPHARLRSLVNVLAKKRGEWAGVPMPLDGEQLVIAPSYPFAKALGKRIGKVEEEDEGEKLQVRNTFHSAHKRCNVVVFEKENGRVSYGLMPAVHSMNKQLATLGCSAAWGVDQEQTAMQTLRALLPPHQFRYYLLTGMFLERSKRSGVMYLFRKLRPTVAIDMDHESGDTKILCCLCMHPIAHYAGSWAGAMCPTDDVIAHLQMMRGDEHMFWKRATQHPAYRPEAGL